MTARVYDSRVWTGDIPDYRALFGRAIRKLLGLDCPHDAWVIAVHLHAAVDPEQRAMIERYCARATS